MLFKKYRVFNYTTKKFETFITSGILEIGQFLNLPQGELQIWELIDIF